MFHDCPNIQFIFNFFIYNFKRWATTLILSSCLLTCTHYLGSVFLIWKIHSNHYLFLDPMLLFIYPIFSLAFLLESETSFRNHFPFPKVYLWKFLFITTTPFSVPQFTISGQNKTERNLLFLAIIKVSPCSVWQPPFNWLGKSLLSSILFQADEQFFLHLRNIELLLRVLL